MPVGRACVAVIPFTGHVVLRAAGVGRRRDGDELRQLSPARQILVLRNRHRIRFVVRRSRPHVVGDEEVAPPPPVVRRFHRHARHELVLHGRAELPVVADARPTRRGCPGLIGRRVRIGVAEVQPRRRRGRAQVAARRPRLSCNAGLSRSQSTAKLRLPSVQPRAGAGPDPMRVMIRAAGLFEL